VTSYGLDDRGSIPPRSRGFYFRHQVLTDCGAYTASYPGGTPCALSVKSSRSMKHLRLVSRVNAYRFIFALRTSLWCGA